MPDTSGPRDPWHLQRWARMQRVGDPTRKLLLQLLAEAADHNTGACEPKQATLAEWAEVSDRTVRVHLRALEDGGLVARRRQTRADGARRSDQFLLLAPGIVEWPEGTPVQTEESSGRPTGSPLPPLPEAHCRAELTTEGQPVPPVPAKAGTPPNGDAETAFDHWQRVADKPRATFTDERRRKVNARLKRYPLTDIIRAIDNCVASDFHREGGYVDLTLICRSDDKLEWFRDLEPDRANGARATNGHVPRTSEERRMVRQARRLAIARGELPADDGSAILLPVPDTMEEQ